MVPTWTSESLAETVWALNRLLGLVRETGPTELSPTSGAYRSQVEEWLRAVEPTLGAKGEGEHPTDVPTFPLTGSQLESLEGEIRRVLSDRVEHTRGRQKARAKEAWTIAISLNASLDHLHATLKRAARSSYFIIEAVGSLMFLDAMGLVLVITLRRYIPLTTSLVASALAVNLFFLLVIVGLWRLHHWHLEQHREGLGWHSWRFPSQHGLP
jgi:hypothetical protein